MVKESSTIRKRILVSGKVQGVSFRAATFKTAQAYPELLGYVRNLDDGRVELVIAGAASEVQAMIEWAHRGPAAAHVEKMEIIDESNTLSTAEPLSRFQILE